MNGFPVRFVVAFPARSVVAFPTQSAVAFPYRSDARVVGAPVHIPDYGPLVLDGSRAVKKYFHPVSTHPMRLVEDRNMKLQRFDVLNEGRYVETVHV